MFFVGSIKYSAAIEVLRIFEGRVARVKDEYERVRKAKAALDLEQQSEDDRLQPIEEEMQDLKSKSLLLDNRIRLIYCRCLD